MCSACLAQLKGNGPLARRPGRDSSVLWGPLPDLSPVSQRSDRLERTTSKMREPRQQPHSHMAGLKFSGQFSYRRLM